MATYKVKDFKKVRTDRYIEGDLFYTSRDVGMLIEGKIKKINGSTSNMKDYVKKSDVQKMIDEALKGGSKDE